MDAFTYRNGELCCGAVPLSRIAAAVGTPAYVYSSEAMIAAHRRYARALAGLEVDIHYALKANSNLAVIRTLAAEGAGADVVSGGELALALAAGVPPSRIVFSGVGKTKAELAEAVRLGVGQINVESEPELEALSEVAAGLEAMVPVALRVNPDVDARTHGKITTGKKENKFGIAIERAPELYARAARLPGLRPVGIATHIGSQIVDFEPYRVAFTALADLIRRLRDAGHEIERLDLGGGVGISYRREAPPDIEAYAAVVRSTVGNIGCRLAIEPGRSIVGNAGVLLVSVIHVKDTEARRFVVVDGAMNDLIRPSLYDAWHEIWPVREPAAGAPARESDVVGPICETGDVLAAGRMLPDFHGGDLVAILSAGAYGAVMASTYNARPLAPEVLVRGDEFAVIRRRQSLEEMLVRDSLPPWLKGG
ncbi:MAG: diaminopimelate decarboxylase [Alphaproteobacteria bacterium]|nr:diaminopimelate decarboxylase [Alphaproteobacteria bacterium]